MRISALFFLLALAPVPLSAARNLVCAPLDDTVLRPSRDTCIAGHVYDVVTVADGTRFLDLCRPETPDASCRFSVVSYGADRKLVGDLDQLRGKDVEVRGAVKHFGEHYLMVLNDERQFHRGTARFAPDPRLLSSFSAEESQPQDAPELKVNFHHHGRKLAKE